MSQEEKNLSKAREQSGEISRRQFLAGAGLVVGGAAVGVGAAYAFIPGKEVQVPGPTVTVPKYVAPDGREFATLAELTAYLNELYPGGVVTAEGLTTLTVNGQEYKLEVKPNWTLVFVLREKLGLTGTKIACDRGMCGACTVIADGKAVYSCMMLAAAAEGLDIQTVEGLSDGITLHPVQQAFVDNHASQCGYCVPGFIMAAKALLDTKSAPTRDEVREALSGHLCTCGNSKRFVEAVL